MPTTFARLFSRTALRYQWKRLRKEVAKAPVRDCIDHLDFDAASNERINSLYASLMAGAYHPSLPGRQEAAKSQGAYRIITIPQVADVIVYRRICEYVYAVAKPQEPPNAFFSMRHAFRPMGAKVDEVSSDDYFRFFDVWIRYAKYRDLIGLNGLYKYIVTTDITNYFESIQHGLLFEYLAQYGLPREAVGVLGKLLEALKPAAGFSPTPPVGLPVDFYDCSRILAHVFLFEHDRRCAKHAGKHAYVRWMDDQTFGVAGKVEARRTVRMLVESLTRQRLTLNSGKTRFLTPPEQAEHFWLDANEMLDSAQVYADAKVRYPARVCLEYIWGVCEGKEKKGHWDKVYKRILRVAALAHTDCVTLAACKTMIVEAPSLAERVFEYLLARNRYAEYLQLWQWLARTKNNIYEDVEMAWFEQVLLVSPPRAAREAFLSVASAVLRGRYRGSGKPGVMVPAALLVYWFWDGRQGRILETLLSRDGLPPDARRTVAAILCARKSGNWKQWLLLAGRHASREVAGLIGFVTRITSGEPLELVQPLVFVKRPVVYDRFIYDARAWLRLELLAMSPNKGIKVGIKQVLAKALKHPLTQVEEASAKRIAVKVK